MAIDWLTGNMYFVDRVADKIFACDQQGETCVTIVQLDLQNPKGVAVDPLLGWVHSASYDALHQKATPGSLITENSFVKAKKVKEDRRRERKNHYA